MATAKSFTDLASIYTNQVLVKESNDETKTAKVITESKQKQTVGGKQEIGEIKLTKEGGDEKVKKDLQKPVEEKKNDKGKPEVVKESSKMKTSLFDQVYQQIVSEEFGDENEETHEGTPEGTPEHEEAEGTAPGVEGEEVIDPVALYKDIIDDIKKLAKHFGVAVEDETTVETTLGNESVPPVGEATEMKELPDSKGKSLQGKNNKVSGTKVNGAGKAEATTTVGDGKLEKAPDGEKALTGAKRDNKVKGTGPAVKGGDTSALEG